MRYYPQDRDYQPIRYLGRVPVYATTVLTALYAAGMLVTTMLATAHAPVDYFSFSTELFYQHGWIWQPFTCTFVNGPSFFFVFALFCFYQFCVEIERFFGRTRFLVLYALMLLTPALVLGLWRLAGNIGEFSGMYELTAGLFIALATLYPSLEYFGWVPLKYVAFACLAVAALGYFPTHDWQGLTVLLAECALGYGGVRYLKFGASFPSFSLRRFFRRSPRLRVLPSPSAEPPGATPPAVDAILDKIARSGFASLSAAERDQLEKARESILKRGPRAE
jgi:hypothetical protein